jgi:hypothetical protein
MLRIAESINLVYFVILVTLSFLFPLPASRRAEVAALGAAGSLLVLVGVGASLVLPVEWSWILRDWLPALVVLFAYWQAGRFFLEPNARLQAFLGRIDQRAITTIGRFGAPRSAAWLDRYFEAAYVAAYPLVPLGLATLYLFGYDDYADYFWSVVLPSSYTCYLLLGFVPTLPPRRATPDSSDSIGTDTGGRRLNLWILEKLGIGANTFPRGHVAATFATGLVVWEFVPVAGFLFLWVASSIAVGVVVRRYHYLADSVLAIVLALLVWILVRSLSA